MKYYSTVLNTYIIPNEIKEKYKLGENYRDQYRLVVKSKSMAAANRRVHEILNLEKVFKSNFTAETGNDIQIKLCDKYGEIIGGLNSFEYHDLKFIAEEVSKFKGSV